MKNADGSVMLFSSVLDATVYMSYERVEGVIFDLLIEEEAVVVEQKEGLAVVVPPSRRRIRLRK